jgi:CBS-domain-containing membrane protein
MIKDYFPLTEYRLQPGSTYRRPTQILPERVTMESPAVDCMTDLRQVTALTIDPHASIEQANQKMIEHGVRLLLVVNTSNVVVGIITATDILGEKPMQLVQDRSTRRSEILVQDIMTPQDRLDVLTLEDVLAAKVGNVVSTMQKAGRQHAVVIDYSDSAQIVRGLFSASQIARQLGIPVQTTEVARTFAEIEAILSR